MLTSKFQHTAPHELASVVRVTSYSRNSGYVGRGSHLRQTL